MKNSILLCGTILLMSGCATGRPSFQKIAKQLRHPRAEKRVKALSSVASFGDQAERFFPAVLDNFRDSREPVHRAAEKTLMDLKGPGARALGSLLSDKDSWVRCRASAALGRMPADAVDAIPALVAGLRDSDFCVSDKSALALGAIGEPAVPVLVQSLSSSHAATRLGAAKALGLMSKEIHARVARDMLPSLTSEDEFLRGETAMRLAQMGKIGVPVFVLALKEIDPDVRNRAVDGLDEIGLVSPDVVQALAGLFKDPERPLRLKASVVLGRMGQRDRSVYDAVAPGLASTDKDVVLGSLRALGDMGSVAEPSLPSLEKMLEDPADPSLRGEVVEALIRMGTRSSMALAERFTKGQYLLRTPGSTQP